MKDDVIFLHRKNRPIWEFKCIFRDHGYVYKTKYGNVYCVFQDLKNGKPFWIGRAFLRRFEVGEPHWMNVTEEVRSLRLEFSDGSEYYFPRNRI